MHAIEVGRERKREPSILIHLGKLERVRGRNKTREFCPRMGSGTTTLGRGTGWATNGLKKERKKVVKKERKKT